MSPLSPESNPTQPVLTATEEALRIAANHVRLISDQEQTRIKKYTIGSHGNRPTKDLEAYRKNIATIITELLWAINNHHSPKPKKQGFNQTGTGVFAHESYKTMARRYIEYRLIVGMIILKSQEQKR